MLIRSVCNMSRRTDRSISLIPSDGTVCVDCGNGDNHKLNRADIVYAVFLCASCAELHKSLLPCPHRSILPVHRVISHPVLAIPASYNDFRSYQIQHVAPELGQWTVSDIERLCRFGNLRVQRYPLKLGCTDSRQGTSWAHRHITRKAIGNIRSTRPFGNTPRPRILISVVI